MYQWKTEESEYIAWGSTQLRRFRDFIHVQQYPISHEKPVVYLGWKKYIQSLFLVQLHWSIHNSSCTWNVPMFLARAWMRLPLPSKNCIMMTHDPSVEAWKVRRNAILVFLKKSYIEWQAAIQYVITAKFHWELNLDETERNLINWVILNMYNWFMPIYGSSHFF